MAEMVQQETPDEAIQRMDKEEEEEQKSAEEKQVGEKEAKEDEKAGEAEKAAEEETGDAVDVKVLRQITRDQKKEILRLQEAIDRQEKVLKEKGLVSEEDTEAVEEEKRLREARLVQLDTLAEVMRVNPKYEDLDEVVSEAHFDDYVEAVAKSYVEKNGGNVDKVAQAVAEKIWSLSNPYKFMYDEIKKWHPDYQKTKKADAASEATSDKKNGEDKQVKIPGSLSDIPGSSGKGGGWTAARIDAMDESELDKVPPEVYEKYLRNELK